MGLEILRLTVFLYQNNCKHNHVPVNECKCKNDFLALGDCSTICFALHPRIRNCGIGFAQVEKSGGKKIAELLVTKRFTSIT